MAKEIKGMLEDEIKTELEKLSAIEPGTEKHQAAVRSLTELYKLNIDETEKERAFMQKCDRDVLEERELQIKNAQLTEQVKDRYFRLGLEAAGILAPLVFYGIWMRRGFRFEETGTFTSTTFRGLFSKFKPTRR